MNGIIEQLQTNKTLFYNLLKDETEAMFLWKQSPEKWCLLEILCHLHDEECEDFRFRTQYVTEKEANGRPTFLGQLLAAYWRLWVEETDKLVEGQIVGEAEWGHELLWKDGAIKQGRDPWHMKTAKEREIGMRERRKKYEKKR